jgi:hypothetical protein
MWRCCPASVSDQRRTAKIKDADWIGLRGRVLGRPKLYFLTTLLCPTLGLEKETPTRGRKSVTAFNTHLTEASRL